MSSPSPLAALAIQREQLMARGQMQRDELVAGVQTLRAAPAALLSEGLARPWLLAVPVVALVLLRRSGVLRLVGPALATWRMVAALRRT